MILNTWCAVNIEKHDGVKYVVRDDMNQHFHLFKFAYNSMDQFIDDIGAKRIPSELIGDSIIKNNLERYTVNMVNDSFLVLSVHSNRMPENRYRYTLVKDKYYYNYIINTKKVKFVNDSTIELNEWFSPFCTGNWENYLIEFYKNRVVQNGFVSFEIALDSLGKTNTIKPIESKNIDQENMINISKIIEKEQEWLFASLKKKFSYKVNLTVTFDSIHIKNDKLDIRLFTLKPVSFLFKSNSLILSDKYFKEGMDYATKNDFNNAILSFSKCISLDSTRANAYFNRATMYYKLNQLTKACIDWEFLYKKFGDKESEKLRKEKCKNN